MKLHFEEPVIECFELYTEAVTTGTGVPGGTPGTTSGDVAPD